jgi:MYXO-CTERM domain-containing protein
MGQSDIGDSGAMALLIAAGLFLLGRRKKHS